MISIVRPKPSRLLSSFFRTGGITALSSAMFQAGMNPQLVDLAFDELPEKWNDNSILLLSLYIDDFAEGIRIARDVRECCPSARIAVGGPHATLLGADTLAVIPWADTVAIGDCVPEAISWLRHVQDQPGRPLPRHIGMEIQATKLDSAASNCFSLWDYSLWDVDRYFPVFPVEFTRGCPHHCPYCSDPVLRRSTQTNEIDCVVKVFGRLAEAQSNACVRFIDSSFTSSHEHLDSLLDRLAGEAFGIKWSAYAYVSDIEPNLAAKLRAAGCVALFLGIESLSPNAITGKRIVRDATHVREAIQILRDAGIFVHCNFIVGLPGETEISYKRTLDVIPTLGADSIGGGPFYLTPGSTFHAHAERFGITILDPNWHLKQHENFHSRTVYFRTAEMTQETMLLLSQEFRESIEQSTSALWNLSDYAMLCWLSVGGSIESIKALWKIPRTQLGADATVIEILREKVGVSMSCAEARELVSWSRKLALEHGSDRLVQRIVEMP